MCRVFLRVQIGGRKQVRCCPVTLLQIRFARSRLKDCDCCTVTGCTSAVILITRRAA